MKIILCGDLAGLGRIMMMLFTRLGLVAGQRVLLPQVTPTSWVCHITSYNLSHSFAKEHTILSLNWRLVEEVDPHSSCRLAGGSELGRRGKPGISTVSLTVSR